MASELDLQAFRDEAAALTAEGWKVDIVPSALRAFVTFSQPGTEDVYCLRLDFGERLSAGPPSVIFCDPTSHAEGRPTDWPANLTDYLKHPPQNGAGWICNEWTREGRQHHSEWNRPWKATRVIWRVVRAIQDILDKPGNYKGPHR